MCLLALNKQTSDDFEVVVADDGSGKPTQNLIETWKKKANYPIKHAWQKDQGFRLAASRNNAFRKSAGDYLVFLDCDCLALPTFVQNHLKLKQKNFFVRGSRVLLSEGYSKQIIEAEALPPGDQNWLKLRLAKKINRLLPLIPIPTMRYLNKKKSWGAIGCNFGVHRNDYAALSGFDESYEGWGREDTDFFIRLIRSGVQRKEARSDVPVLHIWHPENPRTSLSKNEELLRDTTQSDRIQSKKGLTS